ncbi:MAG: NADH-quinone oxidoreductase subunit C [Acidobacteria bacterium]|nr:NADH-quinone oxidoreductase subunit C [Acidobacteriota bacterium]
MEEQPKTPPIKTEKPAAGSGAPPRPAKPATPTYEELKDHPVLVALHQRFPGAVEEAKSFLGQAMVRLRKESLVEVCRFLKEDPEMQFVMCTDITAVDRPEREKRFDVVYHLYSIRLNQRFRLKVWAADGEPVPSVVAVWSGANWLEREVYDMFGVPFEGHPDLKRILLPDGWHGFPLRKDYPIDRQDQDWIAKHMEIRKPY